jgi:multisubunit Na+/H+ antiporter MnhB subunit
LWTGISVPLVLSVVAVSLGSILFIFRHRLRRLQARVSQRLTLNTGYAATLSLIDGAAHLATRLQGGQLRLYLAIMLVSTLGLIAWLGRTSGWDPALSLSTLRLTFGGGIAVLRIFALFATVATAASTIVLRRDFSAIVALGASGLGIAVLMVLEPAPDVALVQVVVDILAMVILVLALTRLPRIQRHRAQSLIFQHSRASLIRDALIAAAMGVAVAFATLIGLTSRPRESLVTPFYEANAKVLTGAKDIVGAIIVDFRALDTLIEIVVFSLAGLGIYTLLRYASRQAGDHGQQVEELPPPASHLLHTLGIGGQQTSPFVHALAYVSLPLATVVAAVHMMYGHDQPGDGFTAGVIISLALGFWYVVFGYRQVKHRLTWLQPVPLIGGGILLALFSATTAALITGSFLANVDFGRLARVPLPQGFNLSTSFLFEVAICLAVLGSASYILDTLGHPGHEDEEWAQELAEEG